MNIGHPAVLLLNLHDPKLRRLFTVHPHNTLLNRPLQRRLRSSFLVPANQREAVNCSIDELPTRARTQPKNSPRCDVMRSNDDDDDTTQYDTTQRPKLRATPPCTNAADAGVAERSYDDYVSHDERQRQQRPQQLQRQRHQRRRQRRCETSPALALLDS
jgi:uncharacterized short protein YbdD (DUF466 family)